MAEGLTTLKQHRCFGGIQGVYRHESSATRCPMELAVYLPPQAAHGKVPVLYWLSGLTCTWANFTEKAGAQRHAAAHGLILVAPDTSPRGTDFPGEHDARTSAAAPASTSTPPKSPGRATTGCTAT